MKGCVLDWEIFCEKGDAFCTEDLVRSLRSVWLQPISSTKTVVSVYVWEPSLEVWWKSNQTGLYGEPQQV